MSPLSAQPAGMRVASTSPMTIDDLNTLDRDAFTARLGDVFEHSPWIATAAFDHAPFASVGHIHDAMMAAIRNAPEPVQLALLRAHPELAGTEALQGTMTAASTGEQGRLGLTALPAAELRELQDLNAAYRDRFGFPCIIALRAHETRASVFAEQRRRLAGDRADEIAACLGQISIITRGRLDSLFGETRTEARS